MLGVQSWGHKYPLKLERNGGPGNIRPLFCLYPKKHEPQDPWLARSVEYVALDPGVVSLSLTLAIEIT